MTRRQLARFAAASALAQSAADSSAASAPYTGPLDGFESKLPLSDFDPVAFTSKLYESAPLRLTFSATKRHEAEAWQKKLRPKVIELLGGFPDFRPPLRPQTLETKDYGTYSREKFVFTSRPGSMVVGYLLLPKQPVRTPAPVVLCIAGHGRGVDDVVGIDENGQDRTTKPPYEHDFAIQVAEAGMAAVAIEPMAFGARRDPKAKAKGLAFKGCDPVAGSALLLGQTLLGWRIWDVMRTIDWVEGRSALDARRIGIMGISGGGTVSLFSTAVEPRIRVSMVSCYLNTFRSSIMAMSHCTDNYVPGILQWAEMYDVAGLIAPRPFFSEAGERDPIFPLEASVASFRRVKKVYDVFGAPDLVRQQILPTAHEFNGSEGIPFLRQHLSA